MGFNRHSGIFGKQFVFFGGGGHRNAAGFLKEGPLEVVEREVVTDWPVQSEGAFVVALDPEVSEELRREGLAREVVNRVQRLRKEAGYDYNTRIALGISGAADVLEAAHAHHEFIAGETLARQLEAGEDLPNSDVRESVDIDGRCVVLSVRRFDAERS